MKLIQNKTRSNLDGDWSLELGSTLKKKTSLDLDGGFSTWLNLMKGLFWAFRLFERTPCLSCLICRGFYKVCFRNNFFWDLSTNKNKRTFQIALKPPACQLFLAPVEYCVQTELTKVYLFFILNCFNALILIIIFKNKKYYFNIFLNKKYFKK